MNYLKKLAIALLILCALWAVQFWGIHLAGVAFAKGETLDLPARLIVGIASWIASLWIITIPLVLGGALAAAWWCSQRLNPESEHRFLSTLGVVPSWRLPDPSEEEEYVRRCLEAEFHEGKEERTFRSDPAFMRILNPLNSRQFAKAIQRAKSVLPQYPDFDLPYKWLASAYRSAGWPQLAKETLERGLAAARRKSILLVDLGETEWRMTEIHRAVYSWCQAAHCLESEPVDYNAYLLLSYVARGCGLADVENRLLGRVDSMKSGQIRLDSDDAARLTSLVQDQKSAAMVRAIRLIDAKYLKN